MSDSDSYSESEYTKAFEVAKEALKYVGSFGTPPTPDVYEVWYRYAEGKNEALNEQLEFAVNEMKAIDRSRIKQIRQQFFATQDTSDQNAQLGDELAGELGGLQSVITNSMAASHEFGESVNSASEAARLYTL